MNNDNITICPICSSDKLKFIYSVDSEYVAKFFFTNGYPENYHKSVGSYLQNLWQAPYCTFYKCLNCEFCFASPNIAADYSFYNFFYSRPDAYQHWKWEYEITIETIKNIKARDESKDLSLLEIGAGNGAFVGNIPYDLIRKKNILCTEYSDYGKNIITKHGITCLSMDVRDLIDIEYKHKFDCVCLFQVLEHIDDLDGLFTKITWLSSINANLFIAVPNFYQRELYDANKVIEDLPPIHIGRWNRRSFEIIATKYGWHTIRYEIEKQNYITKSLRYIKTKINNSHHFKCVNKLQNNLLKKVIKLVFCLVIFVTDINVIISLRSNKYGLVQWVHLQKNTNI